MHRFLLRAALDRAAVLLKMSMGGLRIDSQWGTGGGQQPVIQLIKEVGYMKQNQVHSEMKAVFLNCNWFLL